MKSSSIIILFYTSCAFLILMCKNVCSDTNLLGKLAHVFLFVERHNNKLFTSVGFILLYHIFPLISQIMILWVQRKLDPCLPPSPLNQDQPPPDSQSVADDCCVPHNRLRGGKKSYRLHLGSASSCSWVEIIQVSVTTYRGMRYKQTIREEYY